jgi:hypothetical protein
LCRISGLLYIANVLIGGVGNGCPCSEENANVHRTPPIGLEGKSASCILKPYGKNEFVIS